MRTLELLQDGTAALRLAMIFAAGAVLWLGWIAHNESGFWAGRLRSAAALLKPASSRVERRRFERASTGSLAELARLRQIGAI